MKATVCFGSVRVIVPYSDTTLVSELIEKAVVRYKKAINKPADYWIRVHTMKSQRDGGILDIDDRLTDVIDDREQLIALYDESNTVSIHHVGDGRSSAGTTSPEVLHTNNFENRRDVVVTSKDINTSASKLRVRRGSEPALNKLGIVLPSNKQAITELQLEKIPAIEHERAGSDDNSAFSRFQRRSLHSNNVNMWKWFEAQEKIEERTLEGSTFLNSSIKPDIEITTSTPTIDRHEPLGETDKSKTSNNDTNRVQSGFIRKRIKLPITGTELGINVVANFGQDGKERGLIILNIDPTKAVGKDGRLSENDCILEINGINLHGFSFAKSRDIFKDALKRDYVEILVESPSKSDNLNLENDAEPPTSMLKRENSSTSSLTPQKLFLANTRKIGTEIEINLLKGSNGLGFSVTTRDNPGGGPSPIYVKNILPRGAAIDDGRLQKGDRLLKVNGLDMTEKTQEEAVNLLKQVKIGSTVNLVVSRQVPLAQNGNELSLPRQLINVTLDDNTEQSPEEHASPPSDIKFNILIFDVSSNDTNSAGLGVAVKGKITENGHVGLFVKNIIEGGAAYKDGRLLVNDQILEVNDYELKGQTNDEAMMELRNAIKAGLDGKIRVKVRRFYPDNQNEDSNNNMLQKKIDENMLSLRNESYYRANYDELAMDSFLAGQKQQQKNSIVMQLTNNEGFKKPPVPKVKPPNTLDVIDASKTQSNQITKPAGEFVPETPTKIEDIRPFDRDAPGRRSISEKRKGHGDPTSSEFYQKLKSTKTDQLAASCCEHIRSRSFNDSEVSNKNIENGPVLGLKKSCSLESLQSAVEEIKDNLNPIKKSKNRAIRGRGCNESFRAAVDRSYDPFEKGCTTEEDDITSQISEKENKRRTKLVSGGFFKVFNRFGKKRVEEDLKKRKKGVEITNVEKHSNEPPPTEKKKTFTADKLDALKKRYNQQNELNNDHYSYCNDFAKSVPVRRPSERVEPPRNLNYVERQGFQPLINNNLVNNNNNVSNNHNNNNNNGYFNTNNNNNPANETNSSTRILQPSRSVQNLPYQEQQYRHEIIDRLAQSQHSQSNHRRQYQRHELRSQQQTFNFPIQPTNRKNVHVFDPLARPNNFNMRHSSDRFLPYELNGNQQNVPYQHQSAFTQSQIVRTRVNDYGRLEPRVFDPRFVNRPSSTVPTNITSVQRPVSPPSNVNHRSNTPVNNYGYLSHHNRKPPLPAMNLNEIDDVRVHKDVIYQPSQTIHYGSLGRNRKSAHISSSAQV